MLLKSAPDSRRWVAKQWRSVWGVSTYQAASGKGAKRAEQLLTQRNFSVDAALALHNAKHHPLTVYVCHFEAAQLSAAQSRGVKGHQNGAVVQVPGRTNQLRDLIWTENHRQPQTLFWIRQILLHISPLKHFDIEEAESANVQDNGIDGQLPRPK